MKREIEDALWAAFIARRKGQFMRDIINELFEKGVVQSHKQAWATLRKWERQGKYESGVTLDLGWEVPK